MFPRLMPDEYILSLSSNLKKVRINDVCVVKGMQGNNMVKTCSMDTSDGYYVRGENPHSISTEKLGLIPIEQLRPVVLVIGPKGLRKP